MSIPGIIQFGVVRVGSPQRLIELIRDGHHDYFVTVLAGVRKALVMSVSYEGSLSVFDPSTEHQDRFAPEALPSTYVVGWINQGRLFYRAV